MISKYPPLSVQNWLLWTLQSRQPCSSPHRQWYPPAILRPPRHSPRAPRLSARRAAPTLLAHPVLLRCSWSTISPALLRQHVSGQKHRFHLTTRHLLVSLTVRDRVATPVVLPLTWHRRFHAARFLCPLLSLQSSLLVNRERTRDPQWQRTFRRQGFLVSFRALRVRNWTWRTSRN